MAIKLQNQNLVIKPQQLGKDNLAVFPPVVVKQNVAPNGPVIEPLTKVEAEPTPRKSS